MKCTKCQTEEYSYFELLDAYPEEVKPQYQYLCLQKRMFKERINTKELFCSKCFKEVTIYEDINKGEKI